MKQRLAFIAGGLLIAIAVLVVAYSRIGGTSSNNVSLKSELTSDANAPPRREAERFVDKPSSASKSKVKPNVYISHYTADFAHSTDYMDFARRIFPEAKAGNADAQFYLWRAITRCVSDNKMYFTRRGQSLTLKQGLDWAASRKLSADYTQTVYDRCHEFLGNDLSEFGKLSDWLADATAAGQPQAEAATAIARFNETQLQAFNSTDQGPSDLLDDGQSPQTLLRKAVESRNPDVLFAVGEAQGYLVSAETDSEETKVRQLAWWLVACQRGYDCSANSDWVQVACMSNPQCLSITNPSQFIQILSKGSWNRVQDMANTINDSLNSDQLNNLNIGS